MNRLPSVVRLIPARAGKTGPLPSEGMELEAHPRAGGENLKCGCLGVAVLGSSPRGRGKPRGVYRRPECLGLIPARAGKTDEGCRTQGARRAHPRAGGENSPETSDKDVVTGSSPRGRGKHTTLTGWVTSVGLIPARAGKTLSDLRFYRADRSDLGNP